MSQRESAAREAPAPVDRQPSEIERRLAVFDAYPDDVFGRFDTVDFVRSVVLFVLLPLALVGWFK